MIEIKLSTIDERDKTFTQIRDVLINEYSKEFSEKFRFGKTDIQKDWFFDRGNVIVRFGSYGYQYNSDFKQILFEFDFKKHKSKFNKAYEEFLIKTDKQKIGDQNNKIIEKCKNSIILDIKDICILLDSKGKFIRCSTEKYSSTIYKENIEEEISYLKNMAIKFLAIEDYFNNINKNDS